MIKNKNNSIEALEAILEPQLRKAQAIKRKNSLKVLRAFQAAQLHERDLASYSGYAYDEPGTQKLEKIYANIFHTEDALVRTSILSGTHAIKTMLFGILRPGDRLLTISGRPYDTLHKTLGLSEGTTASLKDFSIDYDEIYLKEDGSFDRASIFEFLEKYPVRMIHIQRSRGYKSGAYFSFSQLKEMIVELKEKYPKILICVDNCYGEFVQEEEPTDFGADLMAGSLIKNPGGGLARSGGYIVGKKECIASCADVLSAPGLGKSVGGSFDELKNILQGLYLAPTIVYHAIYSALLFSQYYTTLGMEVLPKPNEQRTDIVQSITFHDKEKLVTFVQAIQTNSPVDSTFVPLAWDMPGYDDQIIMASGSFVQGSSIELSADAPIREPYTAFVQGGLIIEQAMATIENLEEKRNA